jgi:CcmD family protein
MDFFVSSSNVVVLIITLMIWSGFFFYVFKVDRRISKLEKGK